MLNILFYTQTVPEFNLIPENILIVERNTEVEVCVVFTGTLGRNVTVTAETGPKIGVSNQATGTIHFTMYFIPILVLIFMQGFIWLREGRGRHLPCNIYGQSIITIITNFLPSSAILAHPLITF